MLYCNRNMTQAWCIVYIYVRGKGAAAAIGTPPQQLPTHPSISCSSLEKCHFLQGFVRAENQISHNNIPYSCPHLLCMGTARMYPPCPPSHCPPPLLLLLLRRPDAASLSLPVWLRPSSPSSPTHPYSRFRSISFSFRRQFSTSVITDKVLGRHV